MTTSPIASAANAAWWLANVPSYVAFRAALSEPAQVQASLLRDAVERNADTAFGRRHHFGRIASPADFARQVPIADYDALAGNIDRVANGEPNVLTAEPTLRLATSSGSTRARKLVPYTRGLQREFNRAIGPWIVDLYSRDPSLLGGCAYWSISPVTDVPAASRPAGAPPIGFEEDSAYLGGITARFVDRAMAVPGTVRFQRDVDTFRFVTASHLLARADLRLISVWHPSFLELLLDEIARSWPRLLDAVRTHDPARAAALRGLEPTDIRAIWPRLRLISCWADAHAAAGATSLARRTQLPIQPKGLLATEAFVTIPFAGQWPVAVRSHVYEFLDDAGRSRPIDALRDSYEYEVVVTTAGGLWRYRLGDRVRVDGFLGRTPSLRFVGRSDHVVDRRGEKLSEGFVGGVLRSLLPTASFSLLAPDTIDGRTRYALFVRSDGTLPLDVEHRLDDALCANPHYRYCRDLGQLDAPIIVRARADAAHRLLEAEAASGRRLGDVKATALSGRDDLRDVLSIPE